MALPLSPVANAALNAATPPTSRRQIAYEFTNYISKGNDSLGGSESSPFLNSMARHHHCENVSQTELSPTSGDKDTSSTPRMPSRGAEVLLTLQSSTCSIVQTSPKKLLSPGKRFPVKVGATSGNPNESAPGLDCTGKSATEVLKLPDIVTGEGRKTNEALKYTTMLAISGDEEPEDFADETAFSTFSAVPDMTMFAKSGGISTNNVLIGRTPEAVVGRNYPAYDFRHEKENNTMSSDDGNTINLLMDFTEQFNNVCGKSREHPPPARVGPFSPSKTASDVLAYTIKTRTPSPKKRRHAPDLPNGRMSNLLDFDIPPAPTPRSMPTITPRELENLKSEYLSEISSLKASLSGKEAEILSLKTAVSDAEKRVGESLEQVREGRSLNEQLAVDKEAWEKRGREMEIVLRNVRLEIVHGEHEREALEGKLDECEKRREAAEKMVQEAESKIAGVRAGFSENDIHEVELKNQTGSTSRDVEVAVEKVARELHTLYKSKHETKVAALKKSYESRWDKKVKDLEFRLDEIAKENEELKIGRDATMSGIVPKQLASEATEKLRPNLAGDAKCAEELQVRMDGLLEELKSVKLDNTKLRHEVELERIEKGELVAACDELLSLQEIGLGDSVAIASGVENLIGNMSRASGLRPPNLLSMAGNSNTFLPGASRIGKVDRNKTASSLVVRPGNGLSNVSLVEKMGNSKARAE